jgi:hypothetical protein
MWSTAKNVKDVTINIRINFVNHAMSVIMSNRIFLTVISVENAIQGIKNTPFTVITARNVIQKRYEN